MPSINPDAQAILVWLPKGKEPSEQDFDKQQSWTLEEAAKQASQVAKDHDLVPWIKSDGRILGVSEIRQVMSGLRAMGIFNADRT
jgi:hypothetical protein